MLIYRVGECRFFVMQKTGTRSSKNKKKMDTDEVIVKVEMDDIKLESLDDNNSCDLGMDGYFSYLNLVSDKANTRQTIDISINPIKYKNKMYLPLLL